MKTPWTEVTAEGNLYFNIIKDGKNVDAKTANHVLDHIEGNLLHLYERVSTLEEDKGAVVVYNAPTDEGDTYPLMRPGTPVYWVPADGGDVPIGYWAPAEIDVRDPEPGEDSTYHWNYDSSSLAQGIVIRRTPETKTVDVCLSGSVVFDCVYDEISEDWHIIANEEEEDYSADGNPLTSLFLFGDTAVEKGCFTTEVLADAAPDTLKQGTYFLSTITGVFVPTSVYTRVMTVVLIEKIGTSFKLRFLVCPDGFGGEKFHVHEKEYLPNQLATGSATFDYNSIPNKWFPTIDGSYRFINTAIGEIQYGSDVYKYEQLDGVTTETTSADCVKLTYSGAVTAAGWLSAQDTYFTEQIEEVLDGAFEIPAAAIWGFTVKEVDSLVPDNIVRENWLSPVDLSHIILTINGIPVPNTYYQVDQSGIWWLAEGAEHAPMFEFFDPDVTGRALEIWFIDPLGESSGNLVTDIESSSLIVDINRDGEATVETKDSYLSGSLTPVLPFNPIDDVVRATKAEVESVHIHNLMTADTTKHAMDYFVSLTNTDLQRSCKTYAGTWNNLLTSGFYQVSDASNGPKDEDNKTTLALIGAKDHEVFQFCFDKSASYLRIGRQDQSGTSWGSWQLITEKKYDPLYLPGGGATTTLKIKAHAGRELVSGEGEIDIVSLPVATGEDISTSDGSEYTFINRMNPNTENSVLVISLNAPLAGGNAKYIVSPGQKCEAADYHMGKAFVLLSDIGAGGLEYLQIVESSAVPGDYIALGDCEAPQYYGDSALTLTIVNGEWVITSGTGIWFPLTASGYGEVDEMLDAGCLQYLIEGGLNPIKLSSRAIRSSTFSVDYSSGARLY